MPVMETSTHRSSTMNTNPEQVERTEKVEEEIFRLAISLNGTLSGEHGIGLSKANYMTLEHDPSRNGIDEADQENFGPQQHHESREKSPGWIRTGTME